MKTIALSTRKWNEEVEKNNLWFYHRTDYLDYCLSSHHGEDVSFAVTDGSNIIGLVPLIVEGHKFTFQGGCTPNPFCKDKKAKAFIKAKLYKIAKDYNIKSALFNGDFGHLKHVVKTSILDLDNVVVRKSYLQEIEKAKKQLNCESAVYTNEFMVDYYNVAGKVTRPKATFETIEKWIFEGKAKLLKAKHNGVTIAWLMAIIYKGKAYYAMSCTKQSYKDLNPCSYLQCMMVNQLQTKEIKHYEIGDIFENSLYFCPSKKEENIGFYKSGFGKLQSKIYSEEFFSKEYFLEEYKQRINNFAEAEYK